MMTPIQRRRGFSLVELLCVMMLLTIVLMVVTLLFLETMRVEQIQSAGFDRILQTKALADQFRADVAAADKQEPEWNQFQADDTTLILQMKNKDHLVYRWKDGELIRQTFAGNDLQQKRTLQVGGRDMDLEFVQAAKQKVVRLRLHPLRNKKREAGNALEFAAALGGDWR